MKTRVSSHEVVKRKKIGETVYPIGMIGAAFVTIVFHSWISSASATHLSINPVSPRDVMAGKGTDRVQARVLNEGGLNWL